MKQPRLNLLLEHDHSPELACLPGIAALLALIHLSPYPETVILKKMSWGNVVEWCVNRLKL